MKKLFVVLIVSFVCTCAAFADVRLPDTPKPKPTATPKADKKEYQAEFNVRVVPYVKEPTLVIPRGAIKNLRAQIEQIDGGNPDNTAAVTSFGISRAQTLMSGLFLSLAIIFGGVWLANGKSFGKNRKVAAGLIIAAFFGASALTIYANMAPPVLKGIGANLFSDKLRNNWRGADGKVKVQIGEKDDDTIYLSIPRDDKSSGDE